MNHMKNALMKRRGKGLDIQILLGGEGMPIDPKMGMIGEEGEQDEEDMEQGKLGLAPEVEDKPALEEKMSDVEGEEHEDEDEDRALIAEMLGKHSMLARSKKK